MLKIIRLHAKSPYLMIILYAVILSFIASIFLIWGGGKAGIGEKPNVVVSMKGEEITTQEFLKNYQLQLNYHKESLSQSSDGDFMRQLIGMQTLSYLINQRVMLAEGEKRGLKISPQEVAEKIIASYPVFQENGKFVGLERYQEILQANRIIKDEFEKAIKNELLMQKFQNLLRSSTFVSSDELWEEYKKENEKVKIDYIFVGKDDFLEEVKAKAEELESYFKENKEQYEVPEKRKIEYVLVEKEKIKPQIEVSKKEIARYYEQRKNLFLVPEERRASHILIKLPENAVPEKLQQAEKEANEIYNKIQAGEDFALLANEFSQDDATAKEGGDLGFFPSGRMVPEFDSEVFSMGIGQISQPVKSQFGYHIIKLTDIRKPHFKTLNDIEVQTKIKKELFDRKAQQETENISRKIVKNAKETETLKGAAKDYSLEVKESAFFSQEEGITDLPNSSAVAENTFQLKKGKVSSPIQLSNGFAIIKLLEIKDSYIPDFTEAKERVEKNFKEEGSRRIAQQKINDMRNKLTSTALLEQVAEKNGLEIKSTDFFNRDQYLPQLGQSPLLFKEAFTLKPNQISQVIPLDKGYCLFRIAQKQKANKGEFNQQRDEFKAQLINQKQVKFISEIITHLKQRRKVNINNEIYNKLIS